MLLDAASLARIPADTLKPVNPFSQTGPRAEAMQMAVADVNPAQAARWRMEAGETISLASAAAKAGLAELSPGAQKELAELDPDFITGQAEAKAAWEAKMLDQMSEQAEQLGEAREKQQQQFSRQAGNNTSGADHTRQWVQRWGNLTQQQNTPARRVVGK